MRCLAAALLFLPSIALAQDLNRRVEGGDILYSGTGESSSLRRASLEAQNHAVRGLVVECGSAPAEAKLFERAIVETSGSYRATFTVGVDFDACERMRRIPARDRERYANQQLMRDFIAEDKPDAPSILEVIRSGFEGVRGRLERVDGGLERAHSRLDRIEDKLDRRPHPVQPVIQVSAVNSAPSSVCEAQYRSLFQNAQMAALENTPPGNMAQGRARDLYNQAMMIRSSCQ